jgi:hypothetical protein
VSAVLVCPCVLMLARTGAPKPIEDVCFLCIHKFIRLNSNDTLVIIPAYWISNIYLSATVFSRSTNAPPQIKRISFVSICKAETRIKNLLSSFVRLLSLYYIESTCIWSPLGCFRTPFSGTFTICHPAY